MEGIEEIIKLVVVFDKSVTAEEKSLVVDDCHFETIPVFPDKVKVVVPPIQTDESPEIVPATEVGLTVVIVDEVTDGELQPFELV